MVKSMFCCPKNPLSKFQPPFRSKIRTEKYIGYDLCCALLLSLSFDSSSFTSNQRLKFWQWAFGTTNHKLYQKNWKLLDQCPPRLKSFLYDQKIIGNNPQTFQVSRNQPIFTHIFPSKIAFRMFCLFIRKSMEIHMTKISKIPRMCYRLANPSLA